MASESKSTVLIALIANAGIAVAKGVGGLLSGSGALLAEAAHSVADTTNEVFLLTAISRGQRAADAQHPFGYGKERFFWSLLAAVGIFVSGALFSIYQGVHGLLKGEEGGHWLVSYAVLGAAFLLEGTSFLRAVWQLRSEARERGRGVLEHVRKSTDPSVKTVFSEDAAALVGLLIAGAGICLHQVTGKSYWDSASALLIGVLLAVVAFLLGNDTKDLLIGEAVQPEFREEICSDLLSYDGVCDVVELMTMVVGPEEIIVAARIDLLDGLSGSEVEHMSARIDAELRERHPSIKHVFLDPTHPDERQSDRVTA